MELRPGSLVRGPRQVFPLTCPGPSRAAWAGPPLSLGGGPYSVCTLSSCIRGTSLTLRRCREWGCGQLSLRELNDLCFGLRLQRLVPRLLVPDDCSQITHINLLPAARTIVEMVALAR